MHILVIAPKIPWPLDQGDKLHMFNVIKEISKKHSITFIGCYLRNYQFLEEARNKLKEFCSEVVFYEIRNNRILFRIFFKINAFFRLIFFSDRWPEYIYNIIPFNKLIRKCVNSGNYDIVISNYWYTGRNALMNAPIPVICDTHDVVWENDFREIQRYKKNPLLYQFRKYINEKLRRKEAATLNSYSLVIAISEKDVQTFKNCLSVTKPIKVLTTINSTRFVYNFNKAHDNNILFYGAMQSGMNREAIKYLVTEIFPEIRKIIPSVNLLIAGSSIDASIKSFDNNKTVTVLGFVPDLSALFQSSKALVLPLKSGSGVKGRILEAMEAGLPVICTTMASEGLSVNNEVNIVIEDKKEKIVEKVITLLQDDQKREAIASNARKYFDENYNWEKTYGKINEFLESVRQNI